MHKEPLSLQKVEMQMGHLSFDCLTTRRCIFKKNMSANNISLLMDWAQSADLDFGLILQNISIKKAVQTVLDLQLIIILSFLNQIRIVPTIFNCLAKIEPPESNIVCMIFKTWPD